MFKDLFTFLKEEFIKAKKETLPAVEKEAAFLLHQQLEDFIQFAKNYLNENPPVSTSYHQNGLGLYLKNGKNIPFLDQNDFEKLPESYSVPITGAGFSNQSPTARDTSVKIL